MIITFNKTVFRDLSPLRDQEVSPNADYCSFITDELTTAFEKNAVRSAVSAGERTKM